MSTGSDANLSMSSFLYLSAFSLPGVDNKLARFFSILCCTLGPLSVEDHHRDHAFEKFPRARVEGLAEEKL